MKLKGLYALLFCSSILGQTDSSTSTRKILLSGYVEPYISLQFPKSRSSLKNDLFYSFKENKSFSINLALVKASFGNERSRANIGLMVGDYAEYNLSTEPQLAKNIFEANAGVKLLKEHNVWLDAGVMPSHIGLEGQLAFDNLALTRSYIAENSPYYETGARLTYTSRNAQWYFSVLALNGWQRIKKPNDSSTIAYGSQVTYKPTIQHTFNSSTFFGNDFGFNQKDTRVFHNFYWQYCKANSFTSQFSVDLGWQSDKARGKDAIWWGTAYIAKYAFNTFFGLCARLEYYNDYRNAIVSNNFNDALGGSLGLEYKITPFAMLRSEWRVLSESNYYQSNLRFINTSSQSFFTSSLAVQF
jgi:hypothetical protein